MKNVHMRRQQRLGRLGDATALPALQHALLHDPGWDIQRSTTAALGDLVVETADIPQVRTTARALWWVASDEAIKALEQTANRLSVLEVQANPGSDPLDSSAPVRQVAWGWAFFVGVVLIAAIVAIWLLPATFWQEPVVVAIGTIIGLLSSSAGLVVLLRDVFRRKRE